MNTVKHICCWVLIILVLCCSSLELVTSNLCEIIKNASVDNVVDYDDESLKQESKEDLKNKEMVLYSRGTETFLDDRSYYNLRIELREKLSWFKTRNLWPAQGPPKFAL